MGGVEKSFIMAKYMYAFTLYYVSYNQIYFNLIIITLVTHLSGRKQKMCMKFCKLHN